MSDWQCLFCGVWNHEHLDGICWRCNGDRPTKRKEERTMMNSITPTPVAHRSDKDKLLAAVLELRALGYWAREAQRDGIKALPEDVVKRGGKFMITDERENSKFNAEGNLGGIVDTERGVPKDCTLHVHHNSRDAEEIVTVLKQHGLDAAIVNEGDCDEVVVYPAIS